MPVHRATTSATSSGPTFLFEQPGIPTVTGVSSLLLELGQPLLQTMQSGVFELRRTVQIVGALGVLNGETGLFNLLLQPAHVVDGVFLLLPLRHEPGLGLLEPDQLLLQLLQALAGSLICLLPQGFPLNLQLHDLAVQLIQFRRQRVDLRTDHGPGLINKVDGLVRKLAVGDIPVGEHRGLHQGGVGDAYAVMHFKALLEPPQNGNGVLHSGLGHKDGLEPAFQGRILLDIPAVLIDGGGAYAVQFAPRKQRLKQITCVHGPFRLARPHNEMQLVDEHEDAAFGLLDFLKHRLEPLLEFTPVLRAGDERAHVQRKQRLVLEAFRHIALEDALRQAAHDGGLAHACFADKHRVVLGPAREHPDAAPDFGIPANDGIESAFARLLHQIHAVLGERLVGLLRVGRGHPLMPADFGEDLQHFVSGQTELAADPARSG